jgi:hypothetical protein
VTLSVVVVRTLPVPRVSRTVGDVQPTVRAPQGSSPGRRAAPGGRHAGEWRGPGLDPSRRAGSPTPPWAGLGLRPDSISRRADYRRA